LDFKHESTTFPKGFSDEHIQYGKIRATSCSNYSRAIQVNALNTFLFLKSALAMRLYFDNVPEHAIGEPVPASSEWTCYDL